MYALGCLSVLAFPLLSRQTFIDENAFLLGQASIGFGSADARASAYAYADRGVEVAMDAARNAAGGASLAARRDAASDALLDANGAGRARGARDGRERARFRSPATGGSRRRGRGAREGPSAGPPRAGAAGAPGREGIVFAAPIGARVRDRGDDAIDSGLADDAIDSGSLASLSSALAPHADALGVLPAFFSRLARSSPWLAKDVVFLALDARVDASGGVSAADAWLREYHRPRPALVSSADRTGGAGARVDGAPPALGSPRPTRRRGSPLGVEAARRRRRRRGRGPQFHATILPEGRDAGLAEFQAISSTSRRRGRGLPPSSRGAPSPDQRPAGPASPAVASCVRP